MLAVISDRGDVRRAGLLAAGGADGETAGIEAAGGLIDLTKRDRRGGASDMFRGS